MSEKDVESFRTNVVRLLHSSALVTATLNCCSLERLVYQEFVMWERTNFPNLHYSKKFSSFERGAVDNSQSAIRRPNVYNSLLSDGTMIELSQDLSDCGVSFLSRVFSFENIYFVLYIFVFKTIPSCYKKWLILVILCYV